MTDKSNWVDHLAGDGEFIQEDTFLRKRSVFTGYDYDRAGEILTQLAFPDSDFDTPEASRRCSYISFMAARSLTAGRDKTLTVEDWLEMLTLQYFIKTYALYSWEAAELILDGQSPGDMALWEEMEWVGDHLQTLLDGDEGFYFPGEEEPITPEMSRYHDEIVSPLKSVIEKMARLESSGVDILDPEADLLQLMTQID